MLKYLKLFNPRSVKHAATASSTWSHFLLTGFRPKSSAGTGIHPRRSLSGRYVVAKNLVAAYRRHATLFAIASAMDAINNYVHDCLLC
ncbi:hypothetical protein Hanom_Chr04g00368671 [Helianthus anomalus]